jgi:hypothetical protein
MAIQAAPTTASCSAHLPVHVPDGDVRGVHERVEGEFCSDRLTDILGGAHFGMTFLAPMERRYRRLPKVHVVIARW